MDVIVMSADVFDAVELQLSQIFSAGEEAVCDLVIDILFGWLHIDDGAQLMLTEEVVVLGLAPSYEYESLGHCDESIHAGCVTVKLIEEDVAGIHHVLIADIRHVFCDYDTELVGTEV